MNNAHKNKNRSDKVEGDACADSCNEIDATGKEVSEGFVA